MIKKEPLYLETVQKDYIWGTEYWKLSCHPDGLSRIINAGGDRPYLQDLYKDAPFPMLIKLIDAKESLSVQVHPGDDYANTIEHSSGKTEMWYVLEHEPEAYLYYGLKHKISENEFLKRIQNQTILEVCQKVPVKKGDVFYIPPGMIHAIGKGIKVAEVQQSSNITYRVYDYNREDSNHQKRELHIEKAAKVTGFVPPIQGHHPMGKRVQADGYSKTLLVQCPYFTVHFCEVSKNLTLREGTGFRSLLILRGAGVLQYGPGKGAILQEGDSIYLPEAFEDCRIEGQLELLISEV